MLDEGQGLGEKVRDVDIAGDVLHAELPPLDAVLQPVKTHVNTLGQARSHGFDANPTAHSLSQSSRVGGWG